jgi:CHAT domain-containing protein/predicted negative regulator of RcsB-dependent stress response
MLRRRLSAILSLILLVPATAPHRSPGPGATIVFARGLPLLRPVHLSAMSARDLETSRGRKPARSSRTNTKVTSSNNDRLRVLAERLSNEATGLREDGTSASALIALGKYEQALHYWQAAGDKRGETSTLHYIGELHQSLGNPKAALDYYNRVLPMSRESGDRQLECELLNDIAHTQIHLGESQKAMDLSNQALELIKSIGSRKCEAQALINIGHANYATGQKQEALNFYRQALVVCETNSKCAAQTLLNIANVYSDLSNAEEAFNHYHQALTIWRSVKDSKGQGSTLTGMGNLNSRMGRKQAALELYRKAMPLLKAVGDRVEEARILNGFAYVYLELGNRELALDYYNQALRIYRAINYKRGEVGSLIVIGGLTYYYEGFEKALSYFQQALARVKESKDKQYEAYALRSIAGLYESVGKKQQSLEYYKQAALLLDSVDDPRGKAYALNGIGRIQLEMGDHQAALSYFRESLTLNRKVADEFGEVSTLLNIARVERSTGHIDNALVHCEEATKKIESLRAGVISQELRASFFATVRRAFELNIDLLMLLQKSGGSRELEARALTTSEHAHARSLLELLVEARADIKQGVEPVLLEREQMLQKSLSLKAERYGTLLASRHTEEQLNAAKKELDSTTIELQEVQSQIRATSPRYAALTQPRPLTLAEIQRDVLDPKTLLLEYALGDERSYLWAVTTDSLSSYELPKRSDLETAARLVYGLLTAKNQDVIGETALQKRRRVERADASFDSAAATLSQLVLGPVASKLGDKRLLIVADGALQYIPFGALPRPSESRSGSNPGDSTPLIVEHEIISLPSASTLAVMRREMVDRQPATKAVAVLADPVFSASDSRVTQTAKTARQRGSSVANNRDFTRALKEVRVSRARSGISRLPFSREEATAIKAAAPRGEVLEAVDFNASRATAMSEDLKRYRIIHFATHGLLNSEHPELSGMVFSLVDAKGKPQNGFLRLHEIYNLSLPAELVVLSACQTGLGKDVRGEGLIGLTRGFMYAGAKRVVASLWQVDDSATAELMQRFYVKMFRDGLRPAAALREAQVEMWKQNKWKMPYYWAGFALQGEWN